LQGENNRKRYTDNPQRPYMADRWTYNGTVHQGEYFNILFNDSHVDAFRDNDKYVMDCGSDGGEYDTDGGFDMINGWKALENN
jgi:hypothetical protein